ncbi:MAG: hypothetical protein H7842_13650, partial [Gammaproteobacteria bacterium SHHR-1]
MGGVDPKDSGSKQVANTPTPHPNKQQRDFLTDAARQGTHRSRPHSDRRPAKHPEGSATETDLGVGYGGGGLSQQAKRLPLSSLRFLSFQLFFLGHLDKDNELNIPDRSKLSHH